MKEQKSHVLPSNYVTIIQLKQRWLEEKERRQELEKPEEQNRDQRQEEIRLMERLNLHAPETDSQARNLHRSWKSKHNRFSSVKNQGTAEASRVKEEQLVVDVTLDGPPDKGSESKANDLGLTFKDKRRKNEKKKQKTVVDEKSPKSEGERTQDQSCEVAMKHRERLPEINGKRLRGRGRNTDEKRRTEDEYQPHSDNVDRIWEIGSKSRNFSIHDKTKTEDNRFTKHSNGIRQGDRDARVSLRFNRQDVQKEKQGSLVWVRKGEVSSGFS